MIFEKLKTDISLRFLTNLVFILQKVTFVLFTVFPAAVFHDAGGANCSMCATHVREQGKLTSGRTNHRLLRQPSKKTQT